ncbi:hypothetical protein EDEG_02679 [Edhazardia aedis USNM 41457]|uniref:Uncharacterized protein n=1 Tax=Edhazardia aedis (strain USNM 41457) TaxID=1003232 RepID=J9D5U1_EDHAE|nr:hypothetical protein EDEG_02679 [Edhazardia aedis USNM 41457]|eukprot:EJW02914.1 hypothetical protein EDEG_02679 [Edhazardia aedis USNM 41457]
MNNNMPSNCEKNKNLCNYCNYAQQNRFIGNSTFELYPLCERISDEHRSRIPVSKKSRNISRHNPIKNSDFVKVPDEKKFLNKDDEKVVSSYKTQLINLNMKKKRIPSHFNENNLQETGSKSGL